MTTNSIAGIEANLQVDMSQVVDIFVSRFEDQLIERRSVLQTQATQINQMISKLIKSVTAKVYDELQQHMNVGISNTLLALSVNIKQDSITLEWDKNRATYRIDFECCSVTASNDDYRRVGNTALYGNWTIEQSDLDAYTQAIEQKRQIQDELIRINTELKDVGRKERKVRAMLAERKLEQMGMTDLLNDTQLQLMFDEQ